MYRWRGPMTMVIALGGYLIVRGALGEVLRAQSVRVIAAVALLLTLSALVSWLRPDPTVAPADRAEPRESASGVYLIDEEGRPVSGLPSQVVAGVRAVTQDGVVVQVVGGGTRWWKRNIVSIDGEPLSLEWPGHGCLHVTDAQGELLVSLRLTDAAYGSGERIIATAPDGSKVRDDVIERWTRRPFRASDVRHATAQVLVLAGIDRTLRSWTGRVPGPRG